MKAVYFFDEGDGKNKKLLGGKGAGLCEMTRLKLPVPPGFTITTEVCREYQKIGNDKTKAMIFDEALDALHFIQEIMGLQFGDSENPLLLFSKIWSKILYARNDEYGS